MSAFVALALKIFAALAVASQEQPPAAAVTAAATDNSESEVADLLCGGWLPALKHSLPCLHLISSRGLRLGLRIQALCICLLRIR
jgi:hypothetical protein